MNNLTEAPPGVKFSVSSDRLRRAQHDLRTREQRAADRELRRARLRGGPPGVPLTHDEIGRFCRAVERREAAITLQIKNQIDWLVAQPVPPNEAQLAWIEERNAEGLITERQFGQLRAHARRTAPRPTKSPHEIARAAVARFW